MPVFLHPCFSSQCCVWTRPRAVPSTSLSSCQWHCCSMCAHGHFYLLVSVTCCEHTVLTVVSDTVASVCDSNCHGTLRLRSRGDDYMPAIFCPGSLCDSVIDNHRNVLVETNFTLFMAAGCKMVWDIMYSFDVVFCLCVFIQLSVVKNVSCKAHDTLLLKENWSSS